MGGCDSAEMLRPAIRSTAHAILSPSPTTTTTYTWVNKLCNLVINLVLVLIIL